MRYAPELMYHKIDGTSNTQMFDPDDPTSVPLSNLQNRCRSWRPTEQRHEQHKRKSKRKQTEYLTLIVTISSKYLYM